MTTRKRIARWLRTSTALCMCVAITCTHRTDRVEALSSSSSKSISVKEIGEAWTRIVDAEISTVHELFEKKLKDFSEKNVDLVKELRDVNDRHEERVQNLKNRRDDFIVTQDTTNDVAYKAYRTWLFPFLFVLGGLAYLAFTGHRKYTHLINYDTLWGGKTYKMT